jgi:hypothetical protein
MTITKTDISKFSIPESVSSSNGKTSGSKVAGAVVVTTGCICFIASTIATIVQNPFGIALAGICAGVIASGLAIFSYSKKKDIDNAKETNIIESENKE